MSEGIPKYRVVFPLAQPFSRSDYEGDGTDQFEAAWKSKYASFADSLGLEWDRSCLDIARAFFGPSCKPKAPRIAEKIDGSRLNLDRIEAAKSLSACQSANKTKQQSNQEYQGLDLVVWLAQYGSTFKIEAALRECAPPHILRSRRADQSGVHIQCPFEGTHSQIGGNGTFVADADESGFIIYCCHQHCLTDRGNGTSLDRALYLRKMLEDRWLTLEVLQNGDMGGGAISPSREQPPQRDLWVVDSDGKGIDAEVLHQSIVGAPGLFDFEALSSLCSIQISDDITAPQLAEFIEAGCITLARLIQCWKEPQRGNSAYECRLNELIAAEQAGALRRDIDLRIAAIRREFEVKQKAIDADLKTLRHGAENNTVETALGALSADDTAFIVPFRNYTEDFAIINSGGKAMILKLDQHDLSKAMMTASDFEMLYRKDWVDIVGPDGHKRTVYPPKQFIAKPPKNARVYHDGFVFKPCGTVKATEYNLFRGMLIAPDPSGSCSLFHDLIKEVWAQGNPDIYEWVIEYLFHIIARPGERIGTSIAIRGDYGDGKSIVFKRLQTILGDMLLTVANQNLILGEYNEALLGKLVTVLEEAAFAKDKQAFDRLKELITGETVVINPKFKAPIAVENYSRMFLISNHDHFLHTQPNDRRYTVIETSSAWQGSDKFEKLIDQWDQGGAARFVYEARNHSFRRLPEGRRLCISRNLKTDADTMPVKNGLCSAIVSTAVESRRWVSDFST